MSELISFLKTETKPPSAPDDYYHTNCLQTKNTIDGIKYCTFKKPNGDSITINESAYDEWHERYMELIENEFPNAPFTISLSNDEIIALDDPFTEEHSIIIKDARASLSNYYWENVPKVCAICYASVTRTARGCLISISSSPNYSMMM